MRISDVSHHVGPHPFWPLRLWDIRPNGRCRECLLPMKAHPVHTSVPGRKAGDTSPASIDWENLHGKDRQ